MNEVGARSRAIFAYIDYMKIDITPIIVEATFDVSIHKVWKTITELDQMKQWFFENIPKFKPEVGFKNEFIVQSGEQKFTHLWKILEVIPEQKIIYQWRYAEYPGEGKVTFDLVKGGDRSKLSIISEGMHSFPQSIPEFSRESCIGGWKYFMGRLINYLQD